ncbi:MAG: hypothetical protein HY785_17095 [Oscillatoriophycideae cyanobacterium NC_groundwater_1537_Pr4_S-0.65um_50_18]|nr:hypothetical protein [Oscillatoriophycideae cyanobacterium NC_groundwater_1537_Pr4_S-0.65um_50_18]
MVPLGLYGLRSWHHGLGDRHWRFLPSLENRLGVGSGAYASRVGISYVQTPILSN